MRVKKRDHEPRKDDEICDYCYVNRVELGRCRTGNKTSTDYSVLKTLDPDVFECRCGPSVPCRDSLCKYYTPIHDRRGRR